MTKPFYSGIMKYMADKEIDPRFFLPPNVVDLGYKDITSPTDDNQNGQDIDVTINPDDYYTGEVTEPESSDENRLLPPDYIELVSQTARVASGGTVVVDVVIDVEDVANASQFDVRLTK